MSLRPSSRSEARKKSYKTGVDADEARRRREDNLVEIRKNKREDNLQKKRRDGLNLSQQQLLDGVQNAAFLERRVLQNQKKNIYLCLNLYIYIIGFCFHLFARFVFVLFLGRNHSVAAYELELSILGFRFLFFIFYFLYFLFNILGVDLGYEFGFKYHCRLLAWFSFWNWIVWNSSSMKERETEVPFIGIFFFFLSELQNLIR